MAKKAGYTLEQHEQLGIELHAMRNRLLDISVELSNAYPVKLSDMVKKITTSLDSLRCELDNKVCDENRELKEATRVYYRGNRLD